MRSITVIETRLSRGPKWRRWCNMGYMLERRKMPPQISRTRKVEHGAWNKHSYPHALLDGHGSRILWRRQSLIPWHWSQLPTSTRTLLRELYVREHCLVIDLKRGLFKCFPRALSLFNAFLKELALLFSVYRGWQLFGEQILWSSHVVKRRGFLVEAKACRSLDIHVNDVRDRARRGVKSAFNLLIWMIIHPNELLKWELPKYMTRTGIL
jgi:hypothetical protein